MRNATVRPRSCELRKNNCGARATTTHGGGDPPAQPTRFSGARRLGPPHSASSPEAQRTNR